MAVYVFDFVDACEYPASIQSARLCAGNRVEPQQGMHPELIKAHLRMRDTTPAAVADELGVTRTAVASTITGKIKSQRIRAHLAKLIGKPESELWPEGAKPHPGLRRRMLPKVARDEFGFPADAQVIASNVRPFVKQGGAA